MTQARPVCFITPPSSFLLDERVFVSLGILKVAAALESAGVPVNFLDLSGIENYIAPLEEYVAGSTDAAIGITVTTPQLPAVMRIAATIRRLRPDLKIILGGPHVTLVHSAWKLEVKRGVTGRAHKALAQLQAHFDILCSGDGEFAIFEALKADAPKIVDGDDPKGGLFLTDKTFSETPFPARHLVDMASYRYSIEGRSATSLVGQLGCPMACGFCGGRNSKSLRVMRNRSVASIVEEIEHLHNTFGYAAFMFYDDELNISRSFVDLMNGIADLQDRIGVDFRLRGFIKSELFTAEQAAAMYRAGFRWLLCGFEGAHDRILTNINKRATLADNTRCVALAKAAGLKIKALMSAGHPGESEETVGNIRDWLIASEVDDFDCTIITTYPGTPYYDFAERSGEGIWTYTHPKTGDRLHSYEVDYAETADYYKGDPKGGYKSYVFTDHLPAERLVELRNEVEDSVRVKLGIPFNPGVAAQRFEHSMGQGLPGFIHKTSLHHSYGPYRENACPS